MNKRDIKIKDNIWLFRNSPDFPLSVFREKQHKLEFHSHQALEIFFVAGDGLEHRYEHTEKTPLRRGEVFVIPKGIAHSYIGDGEADIINLLFDENKLPLPFFELSYHAGFHYLFQHSAEYWLTHGSYPHLQLTEKQFAEIESLLDSCIEAFQKDRHISEVMRIGYLLLILAKLCDISVQQYRIVNYRPLAIVKVISYINQHFSEDLSVKKLAKMYSMSENTFLRHFKKTCGKSPKHYIIELRLEKAMTLLKETNLSVGEVAEKTGFNSVVRFSAIFKKYYKVSPGSLKKKSR